MININRNILSGKQFGYMYKVLGCFLGIVIPHLGIYTKETIWNMERDLYLIIELFIIAIGRFNLILHSRGIVREGHDLAIYCNIQQLLIKCLWRILTTRENDTTWSKKTYKS